MSKSACIVPWTNFVIAPDGRATFCCDAPQPLTIDGRIGSVYKDSIDDLWNAPEILDVRAAMARGERPETCRVCWDREASGGISRRLLTNENYRALGGRLPLDGLARVGAETGYRLERPPDWFTLELGNVCDLKCRSCSPLFSSRIAADPVHSAWASNGSPGENEANGGKRLKIVPENTRAWFDDITRLADTVARGADGPGVLSLIGGEPFLTDRAWRLLQALVDRGVASNLFIGMTTNGQHRSSRLEELVPRFRGISLALSIDGCGSLFEYLRHGASWHRLLDNLPWFRRLPNVQLIAIPTLQNANVLDIVTLLRFLDDEGLVLGFNSVSWPERLRPANLPPYVRRIALGRLRHYLEADCKPANVRVVRGYCEALEAAGDEFDEALFDEFIRFTDDLDRDRNESLAEVAPELTTLIRAAGIEWSGARCPKGGEREHAGSVRSQGGATQLSELPFRGPEVHRRLSRTISPSDVIFPGFEAVQRGSYLSSGLEQLARIDTWLRECGHPGLAASRAVADFGCHYGRMTRALKAGLPLADVYACDIDVDAVRFCAEELGALPAVTGWHPDQDDLPISLDAIVCISLLTHTPLIHWRRVLSAWAGMLCDGGVAAFTFLSGEHAKGWLAGTMPHYGDYPADTRAATVQAVDREGFGFAPLTSGYGGEPLYGVAFANSEVVKREVAAAGLELLALPAEAAAIFGQNLALVRKPGGGRASLSQRGASIAHLPRIEIPAIERSLPVNPGREPAGQDVAIVALFDPRCYAPGDEGRGSGHNGSMWARLAAQAARPALPADLGFADPRVPEVREAQARLARAHGIEGFCYLYFWERGPRWDAPLRDLVATGRPDFPFCVMVVLSPERLASESLAPERLTGPASDRLFDELAPMLRDRRYLTVDGRPFLAVRGGAQMDDAKLIARSWRAAAAACGIGEIHLAGAEPVPPGSPEYLGFDSFVQSPGDGPDWETVATRALLRPWPGHRLFRSVRLDRIDRGARVSGPCDIYEYWLRSAVEATRARGEKLVFLESWNDWLGGHYLEPDDRDGRAALEATLRAARGPGSGLMLLRRLRDSLGDVNGSVGKVLAELGRVLASHETAQDRLLASVEAALGRNRTEAKEVSRWVPVASRQLPPSGGRFSLDRVGILSGEDLWALNEPVALRSPELNVAGWCHTANCMPEEVDLFLVLESMSGTSDVSQRVPHRVSRPDVAAAIPGYPRNCGFDVTLNLSQAQPGEYRIAIVQLSPAAAYRDATETRLRIGQCSSD